MATTFKEQSYHMSLPVSIASGAIPKNFLKTNQCFFGVPRLLPQARNDDDDYASSKFVNEYLTQHVISRVVNKCGVP